MGNKQTCCVQTSPQQSSRKTKTKIEKYRPASVEAGLKTGEGTESTNHLQHISEREPDDGEGDPSTHPSAGTLFLTRSKHDLKNLARLKASYRHSASAHFNHSQHSQMNGSRSHHGELGVENDRLSKKFSSCSTIYLDDSTVSQPNLKSTIKCVALAIYYHMKNRDSDNNTGDLTIFDEKLHPLSKDPVPNDYDKRVPEHKHIYKFVRTLFNAAQLTAECAIVTLVYLERLLTYSEIDLCPSNWKRITLGSILLASKVWDDQAVWNVDYCQILKDTNVEDMNELERQFLELLQFNINVPSSVYAKYYFDLRALAEANDLSFPTEPLNKERAVKLEALSSVIEDKFRDIHKVASLRRPASLDALTSPQGCTAKAIIS